MRFSNLGAAVSKLRHESKQLRMRWEQAKEGWDDEVSRDFESKQLDPIHRSVEQSLRGMDELKQFLTRMVNDVGRRE